MRALVERAIQTAQVCQKNVEDNWAADVDLIQHRLPRLCVDGGNGYRAPRSQEVRAMRVRGAALELVLDAGKLWLVPFYADAQRGRVAVVSRAQTTRAISGWFCAVGVNGENADHQKDGPLWIRPEYLPEDCVVIAAPRAEIFGPYLEDWLVVNKKWAAGK